MQPVSFYLIKKNKNITYISWMKDLCLCRYLQRATYSLIDVHNIIIQVQIIHEAIVMGNCIFFDQEIYIIHPNFWRLGKITVKLE